MENCIFCKIENENSEKKIYENDSFFSILDTNPVIEGHSLVISKKHVKTALDVHDNLGPELLDCIKNTALKLIKEKDAEGFNVFNNNFEVAGQVVDHVHFHIIPRKKDDGLKGKFVFG
jgi:histidine triad (HIT) family protein